MDLAVRPFFKGVIQMKLKEAIELTLEFRDTAISEEKIKNFIENCDKSLFKNTVLTHEGYENHKPFEERYPLDADDELIAGDEHSYLYVYYAMAQIDFFNAETERYTNSMIMYNNSLNEFKKEYTRLHLPLQKSKIITN